MRYRLPTNLTLVAAVLVLAACQTISPYSPTAYEHATALKAEALTLMDKATGPADANAEAIQAIKLNLEKAYEYANGRPLNEIATSQWAIIKNPEKKSFGGFLQRWLKEKKLSPAFITEAKLVVADDFDQVIGLESGKQTSGGTQPSK